MSEDITWRLERIEMLLSKLVEAEPPQEWYDTKTAGEMVGRSAYSVREWCRNGRVHAEKRACGRGAAKEWMISNQELQRVKAEGLLPIKPSR